MTATGAATGAAAVAAFCTDFGIGGVPAFGAADVPAADGVTADVVVTDAEAEPPAARALKTSIHSADTEDGSL